MPRHLPISLLLLRLGIFVVFLFWTLDKLYNPEHIARVFAGFYGLKGLEDTLIYALGSAQLVLILLFVAGLFKTWTYGLLLAFHSVSTLGSFQLYLQPFDGLLYLTAWPMLAACIALFLMRDWDTLTLSRRQAQPAKSVQTA